MRRTIGVFSLVLTVVLLTRCRTTQVTQPTASSGMVVADTGKDDEAGGVITAVYPCPGKAKVVHVHVRRGDSKANVEHDANHDEEHLGVDFGDCVKWVAVGDGDTRSVAIARIHFIDPGETSTKDKNRVPLIDVCNFFTPQKECTVAVFLPPGAHYTYYATVRDSDGGDKQTDPELDVGCTPPNCSDEDQLKQLTFKDWLKGLGRSR